MAYDYLKCFATCAFGLEGVVKRELIKLGRYPQAENARVYFDAGYDFLLKANMCLRCADRVYVEFARFPATTFDELYEGVRDADLALYFDQNDAFPVSGDSVRSQLKSVSDIQAVTKKSIADSLMRWKGVKRLPETGPKKALNISIINDVATLAWNTSGAGLNRRGYRTSTTEAPIRETLAAGIVLLSGYRGDGVFYDPMCGSGTVAIEAYNIARNLPPGINRNFDIESAGVLSRKQIDDVRAEAAAMIREDAKPVVIASDIDGQAVEFAKAHAKKADAKIDFSVRDALRDWSSEWGMIVSNPPYALRMGEQNEVRALYRKLGDKLRDTRMLQNYICADDSFERWYGRRADSRRKLYNGAVRCNLYSYLSKEKKL